jgi:hypothetical protein
VKHAKSGVDQLCGQLPTAKIFEGRSRGMPEIATQAEDDASVGAPEGTPQPAEQDGVDEMYKG